MLTIGSLFSGIGGFDLGLERAGMRTVWFCEQDAFCQRVLARHWPGVPIHSDVCALVADTDRQPPRGASVARTQLPDGERIVPVPVPYVDVLCGGFPCQDLSYAGAGAGLTGARSGLWSEYARLIGELGPRYVVVENVAALLARGLGTVLADLAALGYDAEWDCIPASAVGAPHRRDRVWLVAYPNADDAGRSVVAEHDGWPHVVGRRSSGRHADGLRDEVAHATHERHERPGQAWKRRAGSSDGRRGVRGEQAVAGAADWWLIEPDVGRVAHGVPARVDRLRSLGNALVPQIAEWIGHRILEHEEGRVAA